MQRVAGLSYRKAHWRKHSMAMVSRCNAADGCPAACPKGAPQAARLSVTALGKEAAIPCAPCLDPNRLWCSACDFIYEGISNHTLIWRKLFTLAFVIFLQPFIGTAVFAASVDLSVTLDEGLIYCNATYTGNTEHIARVLNEGTEVTLVWNIDIHGIRNYWLNEGVGGVTVSHSVVPDLVSQKWNLIDRTSGISRLVGSLQEALSFLTRLERFPVMDRSLLEKGRQYRLGLTLEEHLGLVEEDWFSRWWGYEKTKYNLDFTNP